ncbi:hypothetical protein EPUS_07043 [Endocarpon pusillum Z07020]|uniref:EKC/KEOPS complex subunit BUD32 n=1 Tax=Endocarpon pusillum (strain Z07020 / HMAS-L-300199) TaxID=1263415 RepID=U1FY05_ENDPU|nr:uncharacterized protein EPUS_07043 [Endocarpon pusillum Z07020]ERF69787.1 hypothetical protein EPUS_07043 [Endocarpon pusillum Z07020]
MANDVRYTAGMFSSDISKSPFWVEWEKRYEARQRSRGSYVTAGHSFWLKDNMDYKVLSAKGLGAFASVWMGKSSTGRILAVKRYQNSGNIRIKEQVPHIIQIGTPRGETSPGPGIPSMVEVPMDYYDRNLFHLMNATKTERGLIGDFIMIPPWYHTVLTQILEALRFLHSKEMMVIHRDICPENILYNKTDHFILAGFSLARIYPTPRGEYWDRRSYKYLAPEVYDGHEETTAIDVWAMGILCLDMMNLLPRVTIDPAQRNFLLFKRVDWCGRMLELAQHIDKPEVEMMVAKDIHDRYSANSVLEFVRSSPSSKRQQIRPSLGLLYSFFRQDPELSHLNNQEILEFAVGYLDDSNFKPRPKPQPSQETGGFQGDGSRRSARTGPQNVADIPVAKLLVLGAEMGLLGLDSALGMLALTSAGRILQEDRGRSLGIASAPCTTPRPTVPTSTTETRATKPGPAEIKTGAKPSGPADAGSNVVPSTSVSKSDLPAGTSKGEQPAQKGEQPAQKGEQPAQKGEQPAQKGEDKAHGSPKASETGRVQSRTQGQLPQQQPRQEQRQQQQHPHSDSTSEPSPQQLGQRSSRGTRRGRPPNRGGYRS